MAEKQTKCSSNTNVLVLIKGKDWRIKFEVK